MWGFWTSQKVLILFFFVKINKNKQTNETETQTIKKAQWLKAPAANYDDLSYSLQAHMVEGKNKPHKLSSDFQLYPMATVPTHTK